MLGALWDLVWSGEVSNDSLEPLRSLAREASRSRERGRALPERCGVGLREAASAEELPGGFGCVYDVYRATRIAAFEGEPP